MATQANVQLAKAASQAAKSLSPLINSTDAIMKLATAFKTLEESIDVTEREGTEAASKEASGGVGFSRAVEKWETAANKLNIVLDKIISRSPGTPEKPSSRKLVKPLGPNSFNYK